MSLGNRRRVVQLGAWLALGVSLVLVLVAIIYAGVAPDGASDRAAWAVLGAFVSVTLSAVACGVAND